MRQSNFAVSIFALLCLCSTPSHSDPRGKLGKAHTAIVAPDTAQLFRPAINPPKHPAFLVQVRYPAAITPAASQALAVAAKEALLRSDSEYSAETPAAHTTDYYRVRIADAIAKSAFFAIGFFDHLSGLLPEDTVGLIPCSIDISSVDHSRIAMDCSASDDDIPSVLYVEYSVDRSFIDLLSPGFSALSATFGPYVTPEWIVSTGGQAAPFSNGVIASTYFGFGPANAYPQILNNVRLESGYLDFVGRLGRAGADKVFSGTALVERRDYKPPFVAPYHETYYTPRIVELKRDNIALALSNGEGRREFLRLAGDYDFLTRVVAESLNTVHPYLALRDDWRTYLALFDHQLAEQWPQYPLPQALTSRARLLKAVLNAERQLAARIDRRFAKAVLFGPAGDAISNQITAEFALVESARKTHRSLNWGLAIGALIAANDRTPAGFETAFNQIQTMESDALTKLEAQQSAFDARVFAEGNASTVRLSLLGDANLEVSAANGTELRNQLRAVYEKNFPIELQSREFDLMACARNAGEDTISPTAELHWSGACEGRMLGAGLLTVQGDAHNVSRSDMRQWEPGHLEFLVMNDFLKCDTAPIDIPDSGTFFSQKCAASSGSGYLILEGENYERKRIVNLTDIAKSGSSPSSTSADKAFVQQHFNDFLVERTSLIALE